MTTPRLHHYVPQFYLRRFVDAGGRLWLWDRLTDRVFAAGPRSIAVERDFYYVAELEQQGHDPMTMERQFAALEYDVARITEQWLKWIRGGELGDEIPVPEQNRALVSLYIALQFLLTADSREVLVAFLSAHGHEPGSPEEKRRLHTDLLWDEQLVQRFADRIGAAAWLFGRNRTATPFITSDNPVAFRTGDNTMWLKAGVLSEATYVVFPLAPDVVMYCYPLAGPWATLDGLDSRISPIPFTDDFVESENSGQVFMASRFVIACSDDYVTRARAFAATIGTDIYAPDGWSGSDGMCPQPGEGR